MLNINRLVLGPVATNCYVVSNEDTKEAIVIDPAEHAGKIIKVLEKEGAALKAILLTHGHFDHMTAANGLREKTGAKLYAHEAEAELLKTPELNLSVAFTGMPVSTEADVLVKDGEVLALAGMELKVIHTPGHTKGGCCYLLENQGILFSGDTLFQRTIGRTDFPTGDYQTLLDSIRKRLFVLNEEIKVLPGHNDTTTIAYEKKYNFEV